MLIEQDQLIDDHSAQCQKLRLLQAFDGHRFTRHSKMFFNSPLNGSMAFERSLWWCLAIVWINMNKR
jgi:hypothetical protein